MNEKKHPQTWGIGARYYARVHAKVLRPYRFDPDGPPPPGRTHGIAYKNIPSKRRRP